MSEMEHLFTAQVKKIATLSSEVEDLTKHLRDFEVAANAWKKGYEDMEKDYKRKLANAEQTIGELEKELDEVKRVAYP